jgi:hypothetical protein
VGPAGVTTRLDVTPAGCAASGGAVYDRRGAGSGRAAGRTHPPRASAGQGGHSVDRVNEPHERADDVVKMGGEIWVHGPKEAHSFRRFQTRERFPR